MKLDVNVLRYLSKDDFRTLTAVEMGQKNVRFLSMHISRYHNKCRHAHSPHPPLPPYPPHIVQHEIVPAQLVDTIAGLKHGGTFKCLRNLCRHKLVHHDAQKYDGYRLTTLGYDFLAIRTLVARGAIAGVGRQIGVGKESDVFEVSDDDGNIMALKLHRLGRTSFRAVKSKRDYMKRGNHFSWLYLSRLAALKEFAFMQALGQAGLPVPRAIECNRHAVLMSLVHAHPMVQVRELLNPRRVYEECMGVVVRLAQLGLVHCDLNEFNLLISDEEELTLIDFPQMVSMSHPNARELFERDVEGVVRFFERKLGYLPEGDEGLDFQRIRPKFDDVVQSGGGGSVGLLDEQLRASGFKKEHEHALERFVLDRRGGGEDDGEASDDEDTGSESEEEEDVEAKTSSPENSNSNSSKEEDQEEEEEDVAAQLDDSLRLGADTEAEVIARAAEQRKKAARRAAMAKVSRNASKGKNKGKKKGDPSYSGGGGGWGGEFGDSVFCV